MSVTVRVRTGSVEQACLRAQGWTVLEQAGSTTVMEEPRRCEWADGPLKASTREQAPPLDPEAGRAAVQAYLDGIQYLSWSDSILLACLAYQRHLRERRRGYTYVCTNGQQLPGIHPGAVRDALASLSHWGGNEGPLAEDAMARALAAARAWEARHEAEERAHERRRWDGPARLAEAETLLDQARRRARAHRSALDEVL